MDNESNFFVDTGNKIFIFLYILISNNGGTTYFFVSIENVILG